ncbi:hypothetical protein CPB85DRAFT_1272633, partial [Mucidula mucida]
MSSLPREIVDAIVDCIQTDRPSLSACLLTCDVKLAASSRRYLFRQVKIGPPGSRLSAKAFSDLVVAAPDILPLITTLHLKQGYPNWVPYETTLPPLVSSFVNLRTVHLNHIEFRESCRFLESLKSHSLTELHLSMCHFTNYTELISFLSAFSSLTVLSIIGRLYLRSYIPTIRSPGTTSNRLLELNVDRKWGLDFVSTHDAFICLDDLQTLRVQSLDSQDVWPVFGTLKSLQHFAISDCYYGDSPPQHLPVDSPRTLWVSAEYLGALVWWTHTLNRSNNFQLEVITFVIPSLVAPAFEIISHWKALDATLTRRDYRSLRRVNFIVAVGSELWSQGSVSTTPRADRLVDFISCSCERLAEMGLLYVGIVDDRGTTNQDVWTYEAATTPAL